MKKAPKALSLGLAVLGTVFFSDASARADTIYVSNAGNGTIEKFDSSGNGSVFASGLNNPSGLAFDSSGNLYVANTGNGTVEKFGSSGNESVFASGLNNPMGLAFDSSGNLYVTTWNNPESLQSTGTIVRLDSNGNGSIFGGVFLSPPGALAYDGSGNLYVAFLPKQEILRYELSSGNGYFYAGYGLVNGPTGLAFDSSGNLYVANAVWGTIGKFDSSRNESVFASGLNDLGALAFDSSGNLYATTWNGSGKIEEFDSSGNESVFASGLPYQANFIAVQVPEPATWCLLILGLGALLGTSQLRRHCT